MMPWPYQSLKRVDRGDTMVQWNSGMPCRKDATREVAKPQPQAPGPAASGSSASSRLHTPNLEFLQGEGYMEKIVNLPDLMVKSMEIYP